MKTYIFQNPLQFGLRHVAYVLPIGCSTTGGSRIDQHGVAAVCTQEIESSDKKSGRDISSSEVVAAIFIPSGLQGVISAEKQQK